jgi:hypothetical protein
MRAASIRPFGNEATRDATLASAREDVVDAAESGGVTYERTSVIGSQNANTPCGIDLAKGVTAGNRAVCRSCRGGTRAYAAS